MGRTFALEAGRASRSCCVASRGRTYALEARGSLEVVMRPFWPHKKNLTKSVSGNTDGKCSWFHVTLRGSGLYAVAIITGGFKFDTTV